MKLTSKLKRFFLSVILTTATGFTTWGFGANIRTAVGCAGAMSIACIVATGLIKNGEPG